MIRKRKFVSFEQARLLKEKGWDINTGTDCWIKTLEGVIMHNDEPHDRSTVHLMQPEYWLVKEWLLLKHDIWIEISRSFDFFNIAKISQFNAIIDETTDFELDGLDFKDFKTPIEADSAAFDYILNKVL